MHSLVVVLGWLVAVVCVGVGCWAAFRRRRTPDALLVATGGIAIATWNICAAEYLTGPLDYRLSAIYLTSVSVGVTAWVVVAFRTVLPGWWPPVWFSLVLVGEPLLIALGILLPEDAWGSLFWPETPWRAEPLGPGFGIHSTYCIAVIAVGAAPLVRRFGERGGWDRFLAGATVVVVAAGVGAQLAGWRFMPLTAFATLMLIIALFLRSDPHDLGAVARSAETDPVTGVMSRQGLDVLLERAVERAMSRSSSLAVMVIDIDSFKSINDTFGHLAGDAVLKHVATRVAVVTGGMVGRFGGDELVVVLPEIDTAAGVVLGHRIVGDEGLAMLEPEVCIAPTLSLGVAEHRGGTARDLLSAADRAMYVVKRAGGNGVATEREVAV